jgi:uncharacterized NAD(P)/FAD-binding protein YdhS
MKKIPYTFDQNNPKLRDLVVMMQAVGLEMHVQLTPRKKEKVEKIEVEKKPHGKARGPLPQGCKPHPKALKQYLELERKMVQADKQNHCDKADKLRDQMDPVWNRLSAKEREFLNRRGPGPRGSA